jgi:methionine-rich copper-binding protein CopC
LQFLDELRGFTTVVSVKRLLVGAALILLFSAQFETSAHAHDDATSTTPAAGAVVASPAEVTITFSDEVNHELVTGVLRGPNSERVELDGGRQGEGTAVVLAVPQVLADGLWTVTWSAISSDSHPVSGAFAFTVDDTAVPVTTESPLAPESVEKKPVSPYVLFGLSVALLIGLAFGVSAARPRRG